MEAFHLALVMHQLENSRGAHVIRKIRRVFVVPHHLGATARVVGVDVGERATDLQKSPFVGPCPELGHCNGEHGWGSIAQPQVFF